MSAELHAESTARAQREVSPYPAAMYQLREGQASLYPAATNPRSSHANGSFMQFLPPQFGDSSTDDNLHMFDVVQTRNATQQGNVSGLAERRSSHGRPASFMGDLPRSRLSGIHTSMLGEDDYQFEHDHDRAQPDDEPGSMPRMFTNKNMRSLAKARNTQKVPDVATQLPQFSFGSELGQVTETDYARHVRPPRPRAEYTVTKPSRYKRRFSDNGGLHKKSKTDSGSEYDSEDGCGVEDPANNTPYTSPFSPHAGEGSDHNEA